MSLISLLAVVQSAQSVALLGGGCLVENEKLTISGAYMMHDGQVSKASSSYQLALHDQITLPEDNELPWTQVSPGMELPGEFRNFTYQNKIYPAYILGGLAGRNLDVQSDPLTGARPSADQVTASYFEALNDGLDVGVFHDNKYTLLFNPESPHDLNIISIVEHEAFKLNPTRGSVPSYAKGFSAAHRRNLVYIVASEHVYVFDLETSTWNSHLVPGLVAARSGCLHLYGTILIYAFGMVNDMYSSKTYFIDTVSWKLTNQLGSTPKPIPDPPKADLKILVILITSAVALLIFIATYGFIRFRRHQNTLPPPEFYTEKIWVNPTISTCSLDFNLYSDPVSSFDKALTPSTSNTPFSSNNIFDY